MKKLLIVYHSQSGTTALLAAAAMRGAQREAEVETRLVRAADAGLAELVWADALLLAGSENFGYLCGGLLDFLARVFYPAIALGITLPYAAIVSAGNDGRGAVTQIERITAGFPLRQVAEPEIVRGDVDAAAVERCELLGQTIATGLALGIF